MSSSKASSAAAVAAKKKKPAAAAVGPSSDDAAAPITGEQLDKFSLQKAAEFDEASKLVEHGGYYDLWCELDKRMKEKRDEISATAMARMSARLAASDDDLHLAALAEFPLSLRLHELRTELLKMQREAMLIVELDRVDPSGVLRKADLPLALCIEAVSSAGPGRDEDVIKLAQEAVEQCKAAWRKFGDDNGINGGRAMDLLAKAAVQTIAENEARAVPYFANIDPFVANAIKKTSDPDVRRRAADSGMWRPEVTDQQTPVVAPELQ